jgi:DNA-binding MarR family transcriptional regulator
MFISDQKTVGPLWRAAQVRGAVMRLSRRLRIERKGEPLSGSKLSVMGWLLRSGGMTPTAIAEVEHIRPQSLTRLLAALDADGLTRRRGGESDRRQVIIELTETGRDALRQDIAQRDAWLNRAIEHVLSPVEQELILLAAQLMDRLATAEFPDDGAD